VRQQLYDRPTALFPVRYIATQREWGDRTVGDVVAIQRASTRAHSIDHLNVEDSEVLLSSSGSITRHKNSLMLSLEQQTDSALLASVLSGGRAGHLVADRLVSHFGGLASVVSASVAELCRFGGLTKGEVLAIKALQAAAIRLVRSELDNRCIITDWQSLIDYLSASYSRDIVENFRVLFLNSRNRLLADEVVARGTVNHVSPYPREIFKRAMELGATALILVHNHPSGDPTPSAEDIAATIRIADLAVALQMRVHDHVVISRGGVASFRELGLLPTD
jgi:DNA repair protein RadC